MIAFRLALAAARPAARIASRQLSVAASRFSAAATSAAFARMQAPARTFASKPADVDLIRRLGAEIDYENRPERKADIEDEMEYIETFLKKNDWEIKDVAGSKDVTMTRKDGSETITIFFNTDALNSEMDFEDDESESVLTISVVFQKEDSDSAIEFTVEIRNEHFMMESIASYAPSALAVDQSVSGDWQRRSLYDGPAYASLDENLQESFEEFLVTRGFDDDLARFILSYVDMKEQKEYVLWLNRIKKFVE